MEVECGPGGVCHTSLAIVLTYQLREGLMNLSEVLELVCAAAET